MAVIKSIGEIVILLIVLSIPAGMITNIIESLIEFIFNPKGPECAILLAKYRYLGGTCWGTAGCDNENCWRRESCPVCQNEVTEEVIEELQKMIEERRKELEAADSKQQPEKQSNTARLFPWRKS